MRESGNKNGYTQVDHVTFDLVLPMLSTTAQSVFLRIYRQTFGWRKQTDKIALSQFKKWCKVKRHETIQKAVSELVTLDVITIEGNGTQIKEYGVKWSGIDVIRQRHLEELEHAE